MASKSKEKVDVSGPWFPMPLELIKSRAFAELSLHGAKLFFDLAAQLGANAYRNGDLTAAPDVMLIRGWTSRTTLRAALKELEEADLLIQTRFGDKRKCSLYALTPWPLHCNLEKLDVRPGCYTKTDWAMKGEFLRKPPTKDEPAKWHSVRKNEIRHPVAEPESELMARSGTDEPAITSLMTRGGALTTELTTSAVPPRVTYLNKPSPTLFKEEGQLLRTAANPQLARPEMDGVPV